MGSIMMICNMTEIQSDVPFLLDFTLEDLRQLPEIKRNKRAPDSVGFFFDTDHLLDTKDKLKEGHGFEIKTPYDAIHYWIASFMLVEMLKCEPLVEVWITPRK